MNTCTTPRLLRVAVADAVSVTRHLDGVATSSQTTGAPATSSKESDHRPAAVLSESWRAKIIRTTGNTSIYAKPVVLVIYREDHSFLLRNAGAGRAGGPPRLLPPREPSQPIARAPVEFKARKVIAPLARAPLAGGRLIASTPRRDPGSKIIPGRCGPGDDPVSPHHRTAPMLRATKLELGSAGLDLNFQQTAYSRCALAVP